jgi:hypothetical protein
MDIKPSPAGDIKPSPARDIKASPAVDIQDLFAMDIKTFAKKNPSSQASPIPHAAAVKDYFILFFPQKVTSRTGSGQLKFYHSII